MQLFHNKVLKKITDTKAEIPADHLAILENWSRSIKDGSILKQKETALHGIFTENIVTKVLGYKPFGATVDHYDVAVEYPIAGTRVDLALGKFIDPNTPEKNDCIAPFELKGAKTKLNAIMSGRNKTPVQQAWDYAMDVKGAKWVLVSNYIEIRLYAVGHGRTEDDCIKFQLETITEPEQYQKFYRLLCKENLLGGQTAEWLKQSEEQDKDITTKLYQDYKIIRHNVIHAITSNNPEVEFQNAVGMAQVILDRVLFIAFAEDKGLLPDESLKKAYEFKNPYSTSDNPSKIWDTYKSLFKSIDEGNANLGIPKYNGGLFSPNDNIDNLNLPDDIFQGFKKIGDYDFKSEVGVTILGHIFEQSISDIEALKEFGDLNLKKKDGKRKKEGVVYTPDSITRFIVEKTLGEYVIKCRTELLEEFITKGSWQQFTAGSAVGEPLAKWKSKAAELEYWRAYQELLKTIRIVDPACGSGAFLVAAFDYMYGEYDRVNMRIADLRGGTGDVFDLNKEILNNNLYGVDVNEESIEITKLSLWLKTAQRGKILNSLDDNLRVGDSVIEDSSFTHRAFSWKEAFPEVFKDGGFDIVLGNPPYVRQEFISPMKPYLEKRYEVYNGVADLYTYFFELALRILKPNTGRMGYISSATFFKTSSGENLRKYLSEKSQIDTIIDFGDVQIFEGVTTYPAIFVLNNKSVNKDHKIDFLSLTSKPEEDIAKMFTESALSMPQKWLGVEQWNLQSEEYQNILIKIKSRGTKLKEVKSSPLNGIKTGLNEAFVISENEYKSLIKKDPKSNHLIKPFLEGKDPKKWRVESRKIYIILISNGWTKSQIQASSEKDSWNWFCNNYPAISEHLEKFEEKARKRYDQGDFWWELRACAYLEKFKKEKIIWSHFQSEPFFSYDRNGYYLNNKCYILDDVGFYELAIFNSNVNWLVFKSMTTMVRGGYYEATTQNTEQFPIPEASDTEKTLIGSLAEQAQDTAEQRYALQEQVRNRIHDIAPEGKAFDLNNKLKSWWMLDFKEFQKEIKKVFKRELKLSERDEWQTYITEKQKQVEALTNTLTAIENDLNTEVYKLFDLTPDEIKLIEENV